MLTRAILHHLGYVHVIRNTLTAILVMGYTENNAIKLVRPAPQIAAINFVYHVLQTALWQVLALMNVYVTLAGTAMGILAPNVTLRV